MATGGGILARLTAAWDLSVAAASGELSASPTELLSAEATLGFEAILPLLATVVVVAALAGFLQVGPLLTLDALAPKLERLDPIRGVKNLVGQRNLVELAKSLAEIGIIGWVAWITLRDSIRGVTGLLGRDAEATLVGGSALVVLLMLRVGGALAGIAALDVLYQRWKYQRDQRMTKEEVKREHKEAEGDPQQKRERERLHREILAHDTLEAVRRADVLVVNPTHLAVALRYEEEGELDAPEVVAKGGEDLARRMIRAAEEAGVPVMRDVPLARALYELEIGDEIPEALYEAVAIVLRAAWAEREHLPEPPR